LGAAGRRPPPNEDDRRNDEGYARETAERPENAHERRTNPNADETACGGSLLQQPAECSAERTPATPNADPKNGETGKRRVLSSRPPRNSRAIFQGRNRRMRCREGGWGWWGWWGG